MNQAVTFFLFVVIVILVLWLMYRSTQRNIKRVLSGERPLDDKDIWLRHTDPAPARILSRKETVNPKATGIAKVELELEIQISQGSPMMVTTCWLVEIPSLSQLEVGNTVEVKVDPQHPKRVFPAVPWARLWMFGKNS